MRTTPRGRGTLARGGGGRGLRRGFRSGRRYAAEGATPSAAGRDAALARALGASLHL